jgi:cysteinyl-tRNA synthetase
VGTVVPIADLAARAEGGPARDAVAAAEPAGAPATSLRTATDRARAVFDAALATRDADAAAAAVLELEQAIADWTADTLQSDDGNHARRTLRGMVLELAEAARDGLADPATRLAPLVDALIERRTAARDARDFATADTLRDRLTAAGVEVRDSPSGVEWSLRR